MILRSLFVDDFSSMLVTWSVICTSTGTGVVIGTMGVVIVDVIGVGGVDGGLDTYHLLLVDSLLK